MEMDIMDIPDAAFTDAKTLKYTQQQLIMIDHAFKCQRRQILSHSAHAMCFMRKCTKMQELFLHMLNCAEPRECPKQSCLPVRRIINHWRFCVKKNCPVCSVLHEDKNVVPKDWQKSLAPGERNYLVDLLLDNYCSYPDQVSLNCVLYTTVYAKQIEEDAYNAADSRVEYQHLVAVQLQEMEKTNQSGGIWWSRYVKEIVSDRREEIEADWDAMEAWAEADARLLPEGSYARIWF